MRLGSRLFFRGLFVRRVSSIKPALWGLFVRLLLENLYMDQGVSMLRRSDRSQDKWSDGYESNRKCKNKG
ncbi:hypothetical protein HZ326_7715 [Fusarium oxysporum f. sp. albedinis]|nr:hypothetical protein HZ326_7715 [Fusarium oxysporum f. sp. albedinis]